MNADVEKLTLLATGIAIELSKGKTTQELNNLRFLVGQIYSTLSTLCSIK